MEHLVTGLGVEMKRPGKDLFGRCPFHNYKTPSLGVSPDASLWHCLDLGGCKTAAGM